MSQTPQVSTLDVTSGPDAVGPVGSVRISRDAEGLVISVDGGAPEQIGGGGECTPTNALDYIESIFQTKTGLSPLEYETYSNDFSDMNIPAKGATNSQGGGASGTGADVVYLPAGGTILKVTGPTSGTGYGTWTNSQAGFSMIRNCRTKKFLVAYLIANAHAPGADSSFTAGFLGGGTEYIGFGAVGAETNWHYTRGVFGDLTQDEDIDTGNAFDNTGDVYIVAYLYSDGTNIYYNWDVAAGGVDVLAEASANLPNAPGAPYVEVDGEAASDQLRIDFVVCCAER